MKNLTLSKVIKVVLIPFLCLFFVKPTYALTNINGLAMGTWVTTNGSHSGEVYTTAGGYIGVSYEGLGFEIPLSNGRAFHFHYNMSDYYKGSIVVTITSPTAFKFGDCDVGIAGGAFTSLPTASTSSTSKSFTIYCEYTNVIDFVLVWHGSFNATQNNVLGDSSTYSLTNNLTLCHSDNYQLQAVNTKLSNIDAKLSTCNNTLQQLLTQSQNIAGYVDQLETYINTIKTDVTAIKTKLNQLYEFVSQMQTYDLSLDRLKPYIVFGQLLDCPIIYNNKFSLPYYETRDNNISISFKIKQNVDPTVIVNYAIYFFCDFTGYYSDDYKQFDIASDSSYNNLIDYDCEIISTLGAYTIIKYYFSTTATFVYMQYTGNTQYGGEWGGSASYYNVIPLWMGDVDNDFMANETRMLLGIDTTDDEMISLLTQILNSLNNMEPGDNETTVVNNYDTTIDEINITIDDLFTDFDITFNGVDDQLDNVNPNFIKPRLQKASDFVQQVYIALTTEFPEISVIIIISFVIAVIGVLMP